MAGPPAKKTKIEIPPRAPIIFTTTGLKPDVNLHVFDQEFHVYSMVLKMNSAFFRNKFLDPIKLEPDIPKKISRFSYEWYSQVDQNGNWALLADPSLENAEIFSAKESEEREIRAFHNLLSAMFSRPYNITNSAELITMTKLAEYYGALPILSNSLYGPFYNSPGLISSIRVDPCSLLVAAHKLRHRLLFKECFIHVMGPWSNPQWKLLTDPTLRQLAIRATSAMKDKILAFNQEILLVYADPTTSAAGFSMVGCASSATKIEGGKKRVLLPWYLRMCYDHEYKKQADAGGERIKKLIEPFLKNNLQLDKNNKRGGDPGFWDEFLCFNVDKFPWDESQVDW